MGLLREAQEFTHWVDPCQSHPAADVVAWDMLNFALRGHRVEDSICQIRE
jgi:hypothetical protein